MLPSTPSTPSSSSLNSLVNILPPFSTTSTPRLQALYSDFPRQKHGNATSYHANVEWWRKALEALVSSGMQQLPPHNIVRGGESSTNSDRLVLHAGRELLERIKIPKVGKPLALDSVLSELRSTKSALLLSEFMGAKASIYDPGWLPGRIASFVVGKPLWWVLEQMGIVGEEGFLGGSTRRDHQRDTGWWGDYVFVSLLEAAGDEVVERQRAGMASAGDALYTADSFRTAFVGVVGEGDATPLRELDAKVLLRYLERDKGVIVVDKEIIKFVDSSASSDERTITAVDRGIVELKSAVHSLQTQVDSLQNKIDECTKKASAALQRKQKSVALNCIRSRKQLEDLLQKRLGSLSTLQSTFITVEAAAGDVEIMKSYESSSATLRAILAHPSLQRESIDKTMEALAEANADAKEIDDAVRFGADVALGVEESIDDAELEEEWKALVREAEADERTKATEGTELKLAEAGKTPNGIPASGKHEIIFVFRTYLVIVWSDIYSYVITTLIVWIAAMQYDSENIYGTIVTTVDPGNKGRYTQSKIT
ncbi:hypothetical protein NLJ89_g5120 [Agrocybe chaxingu]|uniref:Uncharacterized protein n=1 Tax=Agrocybe chaxingu TaxID=84603 RepID=A0A9W8K1W2_9AGAR|nr:hypothetical protein NLJ89_g5120 [Agrocybe chaxingu]